ncbi:MAG: site-specific integrase [Verrucomicrobia bacterium]|nr:site-specific integrase [Verrucomicrobiota bacterium]
MKVESPEFGTEAPSRKTVIPWKRVEELLAIANGEMKFILFCGFRAGMRRGEITAARPEWFDLDSRLIHIPAIDKVTGFSPKSGKARTIPLLESFAAFIKSEYSDWDTRKFVLRPEVEQGSWRYRFDFRKMIEAFARTNSPKLTAHVMPFVCQPFGQRRYWDSSVVGLDRRQDCHLGKTLSAPKGRSRKGGGRIRRGNHPVGSDPPHG